jgi:para-nitrobenzyl esterase
MKERNYLNIRASLHSALAAAIFSASAAVALPSQAQEPLAINTPSGTVVGTANNAMESWLGVPYAAAPVGALRWQPPQPVTPWTVPLKANALGSSCAQNADLGVFARAGGSEDCLFLNVYRAKITPRSGEKRPVFVWIHGGALQVGRRATMTLRSWLNRATRSSSPSTIGSASSASSRTPRLMASPTNLRITA